MARWVGGVYWNEQCHYFAAHTGNYVRWQPNDIGQSRDDQFHVIDITIFCDGGYWQDNMVARANNDHWHKINIQRRDLVDFMTSITIQKQLSNITTFMIINTAIKCRNATVLLSSLASLYLRSIIVEQDICLKNSFYSHCWTKESNIYILT